MSTPRNETEEVWVQISHLKYGTSEIQCFLQKRDYWDFQSFLVDSVQGWVIEANSPASHLIRLWPLGKGRLSGTSAFLQLVAYELVPSPDELLPGDYVQATIELTRRGFLPDIPGRVLHSNGSIQVEGTPAPPLKWEYLGSENEMRVRYTYERALASGDNAYLQVERPCIIQKRRCNGQSSFRETLAAIQAEISDYLLIASLVSREAIDWYQIDVLRPKRDELRGVLQGSLRQTITEHSSSRHEWPLVDYSTLKNGLFQRMTEALRQSTTSDMIRRAISFEVASWTQRGLENAYVLCQAALEAIIAVLEEDTALIDESKAPWNKIDKSIVAALKALEKEGTLTAELLGMIRKKLPEFRRAPIVDKIIFHAHRLSIKTEDLWPNSTNFADGLRLALQQRNLLVHSAFIEDPGEAYRNLVRIRVLAERFILAALGVRQEEIGSLHDQAVLFINRGRP
jgi:hypothetical protein